MCKTTVDRGWADPLYEVPPVGRRVFQSADGLCSASGSGLCQSWLYMEPASSARGGRRRAGCRTPCSRQGTGRSCDRASRLAFSANMMRTVMDKKRWFLRFSGPKRPFACALRPMFERNAWSKARAVSLSSNGNRETARFCPELTDLSARPGSPQTGLVRRARLRRRFGGGPFTPARRAESPPKRSDRGQARLEDWRTGARVNPGLTETGCPFSTK